MAKLQRKSAKLFAEDATAAAGGIAQFGSLAEGTPNYSTDPDVIQALDAYKEGWSSAVLGTKSPALEDRNALDYLLSYQQAYIMQRGIPEWLDTETYYIGSVVSQNSSIYISLADNNTNNALTNTTYWRKFYTPAEIDTLLLAKADIDLSNTVPANSFKTTVIGWSQVDLTAGISVSAGTFTPTLDGVLCGFSDNRMSRISISYNSTIIAVCETGGEWADQNSFWLPVEKGLSYTIVKNDGTLTFYPYKGAN